jgi:hypothetical protein
MREVVGGALRYTCELIDRLCALNRTGVRRRSFHGLLMRAFGRLAAFAERVALNRGHRAAALAPSCSTGQTAHHHRTAEPCLLAQRARYDGEVPENPEDVARRMVGERSTPHPITRSGRGRTALPGSIAAVCG